MDVRTLTYRAGPGWSAPLPAEFDGGQTLVLAFAAPKLGDDAAPWRDLAAALPSAVVLGCSTSGEIAGSQVDDDSISVAIARFEHTRLRPARTAITDVADSFAAGARLARELAGPELRAVFVLSDGLRVNGTALVEGLTQGLPADVAITGGLAGDGSRFAQTWVLDGTQPRPGHIAAVGLYGTRLQVGHGCDGGWSDFGPERAITRAEGNVLHALDDKPALDLYKTYLGDRAAGLPGTALLFPLAIRRPGDDQKTVVRTILAIDEAQQTMTFAGDIPQGGVARLMRANTDKLIGSAGQAARQATAGTGAHGAALVISVSCVGRRLVLGERSDEEVESVVDGSPAHAGHVGFYSYGEISPVIPGGASELHNQTMTVTILSES